MVNHNFKVIPLPRCVSAANAICKDIDIFTKDYTSLADIFITLLALRFFVLIHILRVSYCASDRVSFLFCFYSKLFLYLLCNRYLILLFLVQFLCLSVIGCLAAVNHINK
jgi:hypothetical protein